MAKALIDSNVIIDGLTNRAESVEEEREILRLAAMRKSALAISSKQITDIHYVLRKYYPKEETRRKLIALLMRSFEVLPLNHDCLLGALQSADADYEDAVLAETAARNGIPAIVTNDPKGFAHSGLEILSPKDYLRIIQ